MPLQSSLFILEIILPIPMLRPAEHAGSIWFLHWLSGLILHLSFEVAIRNSISRN